MTRSSVGIGSWGRLVIFLIGIFHCVTVAITAGCRQGLDYGNDVELTLNCISTRPSATYKRLDYMNSAELFLYTTTIVRYTCVHPNGLVLIDNEVLLASTAVSLTRSFQHMVNSGTNCTFSGCYEPQISLTQLDTRQLAIREVYCITDLVDECLEAEHNNCSVGNAVCINTVGSYECHCTEGYEGNGIHCENINECNRGVHNCSENAMCIDSDGGFSCICEEGYEGDGYNNCTDINECNEGAAENCSKNSHCVNMDGGFACVCQEGYEGDGFNCTKIIVSVTVATEGLSSVDVEIPRSYIFLLKVLVPLAAVVVLSAGVVVCVLLSTFGIKSRRKPKILALYNDISRKDTLDDNYFPTNPEFPTLTVQLCQSQISILDILERTLDPVRSDSIQGAENEELQYITHCTIDTSHIKPSTKSLQSQDTSERSSFIDNSFVVGSCSTQLTGTDQSTADTVQQCTIQRQPEVLQNCDNQSNCDLGRVDGVTMQDELFTQTESTNVSALDLQQTEINSSSRKDCTSPVYLEQISHDNSNNLHYYTDSEGYIKFSSSNCAVHLDHHDTSRESDSISQEDTH